MAANAFCDHAMRTRRAGTGNSPQTIPLPSKQGKYKGAAWFPPCFLINLYSEQNLYGVHAHLTLAQMHAVLDTLIGRYRQRMRGLSDVQFFQQQGFHR